MTTIVLPAPVSPVTAVNPGDSSTTASSITPSDRIRISSNTPPTLRGPGGVAHTARPRHAGKDTSLGGAGLC
ncbi:hypothetical protein GCM10010238_68170 [Streptomyces griseoviridis]|uniref:Uncharacterized protein n=1 Tax=Streptomyces griseoviridis TaxID=45398 RepID=A0A918LLD0_STRGD|nr:hypothetical protein GCM10010238_68170 [Streptomyces niveoruber]